MPRHCEVFRVVRSAAIALALSVAAFGQCGVERWPVKTGTDGDARRVDLQKPAATSILDLRAATAPANKPQNARVAPIELTQFVVNAKLTDFKLEGDSDYHLVLSDSAGRTIIAEIPAPACVGPGSPFATDISKARAQFDRKFTAAPDFKGANVLVQVKGIGFFDYLHGQRGVAPNGIELHPVLDIVFGPAITSVNTAGGYSGLAPNTWVEIKGANLAPLTAPPGGVTWSGAPEFSAGRMPTQLSDVTVRVNGRPAYIYYVSPTQINVLTPLALEQGPAEIVVSNGGAASNAFPVVVGAVAPSFLVFGASSYIAATHASGALLGPAAMSVAGAPFTPAKPGETVVLYATGFGMPDGELTESSATQAGSLAAPPSISIGGTPAVVEFAGVVSPGLYQFNVVVPSSASTGDQAVIATYAGATTSGGSISVQRP